MKLNDVIKYDRDFNFDYFGFKTLEKAYLLRCRGVVVERIQHLPCVFLLVFTALI